MRSIARSCQRARPGGLDTAVLLVTAQAFSFAFPGVCAAEDLTLLPQEQDRDSFNTPLRWRGSGRGRCCTIGRSVSFSWCPDISPGPVAKSLGWFHVTHVPEMGALQPRPPTAPKAGEYPATAKLLWRHAVIGTDRSTGHGRLVWSVTGCRSLLVCGGAPCRPILA